MERKQGPGGGHGNPPAGPGGCRRGAIFIFAACLASALSLSPARAQTSWRDTRVPGGALVTAMHSLPGILLAGTFKGNIFRSTDGGRIWTPAVTRSTRPIVDFLTVGTVTLAASGMEPHSGMAGCHSGYCPPWVDMGGLHRSTDAGATWSASGPLEVLAFAMRERTLYAATLRGTYRSQDTGRTWSKLVEALPTGTPGFPYNIGLHRLAFLGDRVFAWNQVARRIGSGRLSGDSLTWTSSPYPVGSIESMVILAMTVQDGWLLTCRRLMDSLPETYRVERSRDGTTWEVLAPRKFLDMGTLGGTLYGWDGTGLHSSTDGGRTWSTAGSPVAGPPSASRILPLQGGGIARYGRETGSILIRTSGGDAWVAANDGLYDFPVPTLAFLRGALLAYSPASRGQFAAPGEGWRALGTHSMNPNPLFARFGEKVLSTTAGLQISSSGSPGAWDTLSTRMFPGLAASPAWTAAYESHLSITVCEADAACRTVTPAHLPPAYLPTPFSTVERNAYRGMAISGDSLYLLLDSLYLSVDRAVTWKVVAPNAPAAPGAFSMHHGRLLLGGASDPLRPGNPSGLLWAWDAATRTWSGPGWDAFAAPGAVRAIASRPGETYVGTDSGLYARVPGGTGWTDLSEGLPCRGVTALAVEGDRLAAGTSCGPVMIRDLAPASSRRTPRAARRPITYPTGYFGDGGRAWRRVDGRAVVPATHR